MPLMNNGIKVWGNKTTDVRYEEAFYVAKDFVKNHDRKIVYLDIGCSTGSATSYFISRLPRKVYSVAVDISKELVKYVKMRDNIDEVIVAAVQYLPFRRASIDLITCIALIEHLSPLQQVMSLKEIRRITKNGGKNYISHSIV